MTEERFDRIDDVYERLAGDARMREVDISLLEVNSPEALQKARELVKNLVGQGLISQNQLAKRTGFKPSAISAFVNDKWKGNAGTLYTLAQDLATACDQFLRQRQAEGTSVAGFVWTGFAQQVRDLVEYAVKRKKMGAFSAPAGSGKSMVFRAIQEMTPGAVLVTVTQKRGAPKSFLERLAQSLGLLENGRAEDIQDRIVRCLHNSDRLILIDEVHKLQVATLDVIREIWDEARVPIVMAGTPSFYKTLTTRRVGIQTSELMDQLYSRVAIYRDLSVMEDPETGERTRLFSVEDIKKLFGRGNMRLHRDGVDYLCGLANAIGGGGLRTCADIVQAVIDLFPGEDITAGRLEAVHRLKVGTREAEYRISQAGINMPSRAAAAASA